VEIAPVSIYRFTFRSETDCRIRYVIVFLRFVGQLDDSQSRETVKYGHESPRDSEPRMPVLAKASSILLEYSCTTPRVVRQKYGRQSRGTRNQELLCWRGPTGRYPIRSTSNRQVLRRCNKCGVHSERPTPPLVEEEAPFQNMSGLGTNRNMVMGPDGVQSQK
jgi:hypothetical protein